jgi:hypothetical protein
VQRLLDASVGTARKGIRRDSIVIGISSFICWCGCVAVGDPARAPDPLSRRVGCGVCCARGSRNVRRGVNPEGRLRCRFVRKRGYFMALISDVVISIACGIIVVLILQAWPTRYRWSKDIALSTGLPSRSPVYQARFGRPRRLIWKSRWGAIDVSFKARVSVEGLTATRREHIVEIPVLHEWRPVLGRTVNVYILPHLCSYSELRYFPSEIKQKKSAGQLRLEDLLGVNSSAVLRIYAFAYRPYTGTRWMRRGKYSLESIKPGRFNYMEFRNARDGRPPEVIDIEDNGPSTLEADSGTNTRPGSVKLLLAFGSLTIEVSRSRGVQRRSLVRRRARGFHP